MPQLLDCLAIQFSYPAFGSVVNIGFGNLFGVRLRSLCPLTCQFVDALSTIASDEGNQGPHAGDDSEYELQEL